MSVRVRSTLDVAFWFVRRGKSAGAAPDAITVQSLLYLAQVGWAAANHGQKLMPVTFLATDSGPIEPTIYHIFRGGPPAIEVKSPGRTVEGFLGRVWERFGHLSAEGLGDIVRADPSYKSALAAGSNEEIVLAAAAKAPSGPVLATKDGVRATKWMPGQGRKNRGSRASADDPFANAPGNPADQVQAPPDLGPSVRSRGGHTTGNQSVRIRSPGSSPIPISG